MRARAHAARQSSQAWLSLASALTYASPATTAPQLPVPKKKLRWLFDELYSSNQTARGLEDPTVYKDASGRYHALMRETFDTCDGAGCVAPRGQLMG